MLDLKSATLITLVSMCLLPLPASLGASEAMAASMASKVKSDVGFEIINLEYPGIHVHIASSSYFGYLFGHGGLNGLRGQI